MYNPCDTCAANKCNICMMNVRRFTVPKEDEVFILHIDTDEIDIDAGIKMANFVYDNLHCNVLLEPSGIEFDKETKEQYKSYILKTLED